MKCNLFVVYVGFFTDLVERLCCLSSVFSTIVITSLAVLTAWHFTFLKAQFIFIVK